jgi:hypothetical protein
MREAIVTCDLCREQWKWDIDDEAKCPPPRMATLTIPPKANEETKQPTPEEMVMRHMGMVRDNDPKPMHLQICIPCVRGLFAEAREWKKSLEIYTRDHGDQSC